jgi:hypothetical protein
VAKQGGHVGPFRIAIDALAGLNYIFALVVMPIVAMCVNGNKLANILNFLKPTKKT